MDQYLFARFVVTDEFNLDAVLGRQLLCVMPKLVAEGFSKTRIVEDPYVA